MSIWGEQWVCGCTWSNLFMRKHCRNCGLPRELSVEKQTVEQVMTCVAQRTKDKRNDPHRQD